MARSLHLAGLLLLAGCTSYGVVRNQSIAKVEAGRGDSLAAFAEKQDRQSGELALALAFSGGGTRAAALSYGVLQELRDTRVRMDGRNMRSLDAVAGCSQPGQLGFGRQFHLGLLWPLW
jgi:NTE family protein